MMRVRAPVHWLCTAACLAGTLAGTAVAASERVPVFGALPVSLDGAVAGSRVALVVLDGTDTAAIGASVVVRDSGLAVVPDRALRYGARYAITRDDDPGAILAKLETVRNPLAETLYLADGSVRRQHVFRYDEGGQLVARDEFVADDLGVSPVQVGAAHFRYDARGNVILETYYSDSGVDQAWGSDDDVIGVLNASHFDARGLLREAKTSYGAGGDKAWLTEDDARLSVSGYEYDDAGRVLRAVQIDSTDGQTARREWTRHRYDAQARLAAALTYTSPGADAEWFTADDSVAHCDRQLPDLPGQARLTAPGADGIWCTDDDSVASYRQDRTFDDGWAHVYINGAGVDGVWFTVDDNVTAISRYWRDTAGNVLRHVKWISAGPDGRWNTSDDVPESVRTTEYDEHGLPTLVRYYVGSGADGRWFTADDALRFYERTRYAVDGTRLSLVQVTAPGADGAWLTDDDVPTEISRYVRD